MSEPNVNDATVAAKPGAALKQIGSSVFYIGGVCCLTTKLIVRIFFPELREMDTTLGVQVLVILLLSLMVSGPLLWLIGHIRGKLA